MKKTIIFIITVLLIPIIFAIEECLDEVDIGTSCMIITPITVNASNQNQVYVNQICNASIYNSTDLISNKLMSNSTYGDGVHNSTFLENDLGIYTINVLCNASDDYGRWSKAITVTDTLDKKLDKNFTTVIDNQATITGNQAVMDEKLDGISGNLSDNMTSLHTILGDPRGNSTNIWNYLYLPTSSLDIPGYSFCDDYNLISNMWCFIYRTTHGIIP